MTILGGGARDKISLCSPDCPGTNAVDKAGLELTEIHIASVSPVLGLKVCATKAGPYKHILFNADYLFV